MQKNTNLNNIDLAITNFNQELRINPHDPDLYNNLACLYYRINRIEEAIYNYQRTLHLNPNNWQAHYNLANCYVKKNFIPDAISHYKFSIELQPDNINAIQNLGMVLVDSENFAEALPYLEKAYLVNKENQSNVEFIEHLSNCYLQIGNISKATELLQLAINLNPNKESLQHNLAILCLRSNDYKQAKHHFKLALELNKNNQTAKHMLAALSKQTTTQPPPEYIADLFDQYAGYYNKHLRETLQYKLPEKFRSLYTKHHQTSTVQNTLDLGCGTGLCSIYFRDATVNLIGVDLSKNMLHQARSLEAYDLLIQANVQKSNIFQDNYFDLIIAADVIPYIGELENVFLNIKTMLKNIKNKFLFNIEITENANFELQQTGRYAHNKNYIEQLAEKFNFKIIECLPEIIRLQNNIPTNGMIFLLTCVS
jgi:predicted TPR repeat methyltransferase